MKKKLLCLILTVVMLVSFFAICANASVGTSKIYVDESFTLPEGEDGETWRPQGWFVGGRHGLADLIDKGTYIITDEGYVSLCKGEYTGGACVSYTISALPNEYTMMFDVRYPETSGFVGTLCVDCSLNGFKQNVLPNGSVAYLDEATGQTKYISAGGHSSNVWYTYVFQIKGDRMSVYRKSEKEDAFSLKVDDKKMPLRSGNEFYAYSTSSTAFINVDNVKIFSGTCMTDAWSEAEPVFIKTHKFKVSKENGTVTEIPLDEAEDAEKFTYYTEDEYEYKFKAGMDVTSAKVAPDEEGNVIPVLTIYDEKGKIIDMVFSTEKLVYDDSNSFTVETGQYTQEEYDGMKGYTIELYLWNSFAGLAPQTTVYTATIQ